MVERSRHASVEMCLNWQSSNATHCELHHLGRMGLAPACFRQAGGFTGLDTEGTRYFPRPPDDPHVHERSLSDPVFVVWGQHHSMA